jgi:hypothetical protein
VIAVSVSSDGRVGASLDVTGELVRYNLALGQRAGSCLAPGARVIALSPSMLAWAVGDEVYLLNHMAGREVWRGAGWGEVTSLAFLNAGAALFVGTASRALVLRTATGRVVSEARGAVDAAAWDGASSLIVVGEGAWSRRDPTLVFTDVGGAAPPGVRGVVARPEPWLWRADGRLAPAAEDEARGGAAEGPFGAVGGQPGGWLACDTHEVARLHTTSAGVERRPWGAMSEDAGRPTCIVGHPSGAHVLWGSEDGRVQLGRWPER